MLTVIIVSVAILGATVAMCVYQPVSSITFKQDDCANAPLVEFADNTPRLG